MPPDRLRPSFLQHGISIGRQVGPVVRCGPPEAFITELGDAVVRAATDYEECFVPLLGEFGVNQDFDALSIQIAVLSSGIVPLIDTAVYSLWLAMCFGQGPLTAYIRRGHKPRVLGLLAVHWQLLMNAFESFPEDEGFRIAAADGPPTTADGYWLVLTPDNQWEPERCVLHFRSAQPALFQY